MFRLEDEYEIEEIVLQDDENLDIEELRNRGIKITTEKDSSFMAHRSEKHTEPKDQTGATSEINAKVSYQYPKGNFRFPVMPDYEPSERRKAKTPRHAARNENMTVERSVPTSIKNTNVSNVPNISSDSTEKKVEVRKRPFSPTQIPSPIYGFQKRPQNHSENKPQTVGTKEDALDIPAFLRREQVTKVQRDYQEERSVHRQEAVKVVPVHPVNSATSQPMNQPANSTSVNKESVYGKKVVQRQDEVNDLFPIKQRSEQKEQKMINAQDTNLMSGHLSSETDERKTEETMRVWEEAQEKTPVLMEEGYELKEVPVVKEAFQAQEVSAMPETVPEPKETPTVIEGVPELKEAPTVVGVTPVREEIQVAKETVRAQEKVPAMPETVLEPKETPTVIESVSESKEAPTVVGVAPVREETQVIKETVQAQETVLPMVETAHVTDESSRIAEEDISPLEGETPVVEEVIKAVEEVASTVAQEERLTSTGETSSNQVTAATSSQAETMKKRKPVPFNVVMLRQDRVNWENKQSQVEKKTINEPSIEEVPKQPVEEPIQSDNQAVLDEPSYYQFPSMDLLAPSVVFEHDDEWLDQQGYMLNETLLNFNVKAKVVNITQGPAVTQFEVQPEPGVKVSKITNLTDDIKLCLAAQDIRMEAPIPGKHTIGIEIPNRKSRPVFLREILESDSFIESDSPLTVALGLDITGAPVVTDLRKMPHGLIAGATGSGKSVCINTMLISLLYKATPQEVKLLLIDPKMVELAPYNHIPHLVSPVITDVKAATAALKWAVEEMENRYELFAHSGVRDLQRFNKKAEEAGEYARKLPYIVIIIDELADLMMMSPAEVEEAICRIAQKARACGIHLVLATQRPSVDVITGLIKANIPTRIAFSVSSQVDSRTIIDSNGADKLLGKGDMLFLENGSSKTVRLQGTFVSDEEIEEVVDFVKKEQEPQYLFVQEDLLAKSQISDERDELFEEACEFVVYQNSASTSSLQRRFHIGYNRAARLMDMLENNGVISEARGSKPRDVLMTQAEMQAWFEAENE
ncbi:MAG: DNA translocase FtsK [Bacillus sp. (in: firmicutes)]